MADTAPPAPSPSPPASAEKPSLAPPPSVADYKDDRSPKGRSRSRRSRSRSRSRSPGARAAEPEWMRRDREMDEREAKSAYDMLEEQE